MPSGRSSGTSIACPRKNSGGPLVSTRPSPKSTTKQGSLRSLDRLIRQVPLLGLLEFFDALQPEHFADRDDRRLNPADRPRREDLRRGVLHRADARAEQVIGPDER